MGRLSLLPAAFLVTACFSPEAPIESETAAGESGDASTSSVPTGGVETMSDSTLGPFDTDPSGPTESDTEDSPGTETDPTVGETDTSETGGAVCGDGEVEGAEECDDGVNDGTYGGCNDDCTLAAFCGDGDVQAAEACDDGDGVEGNGCNSDCVISGTVLWTHVFVTANGDLLDDPYFKGNGDVVVHALNPSTNQARTLAADSGEVVENRDLPEGTAEIQAWGDADGYVVRQNVGSSLGATGDMIVSRYAADGVEQWSREFPSSGSPRMDVTPGDRVTLVAWESEVIVSSEGDRVVRSLDAAGNELWSQTAPDVDAGQAYSAVLGLTNGNTVLSITLPGFLTEPSTIRGLNEGGGTLWTLEFDSGPPRIHTSLLGGQWLSTFESSLQVRASSGDVEREAALKGLSVDFAAAAPNGDIVLTGTTDTALPSSVTRLTPELEVLWEVSPTDEDLPFFEVSGLAVGPSDEVVVTAEAFELESQGADGWAILIAP